MIKQEEIRGVIDSYVDDRCLYIGTDCEHHSQVKYEREYCVSGSGAYNCLMKRLDELGVVIKVDRELPENPYKRDNYLGRPDTMRHIAYRKAQEDMAGYEAIEPLIKEVSNEGKD